MDPQSGGRHQPRFETAELLLELGGVRRLLAEMDMGGTMVDRQHVEYHRKVEPGYRQLTPLTRPLLNLIWRA